ncbi:hypothetical protein [Promicromonospora sp. NPDC057488]|uniref:hypothetical protein n=1 Tax=Promicromonospora sp. NPDC057488 TaxID=3346147 RepID=UPI003670CAC4
MVLHSGSSLQVTMRPAESPGEPDGSRTLVLEIDDPGGLDEGQFRQELVAMTGLSDGIVLEERRTTFEWGASAQFYEIVMTVADVAWDAIIAGAAWEFAKNSAKRLRRQRHHDETSPPTEQDVQERGRYRVAVRYELATDDLVVIETTIGTTPDGYESSVTLTAPTGETFVVTTATTGAVSMTRIERTGR